VRWLFRKIKPFSRSLTYLVFRYALNQLLRGCNVGLVVTLGFKQGEFVRRYVSLFRHSPTV
jgi:hypothetical protein